MSDYETGGVTQAQYDALRSRLAAVESANLILQRAKIAITEENRVLRSRLAEVEKERDKALSDCRDHESARATQAQAMVETGRFLEGVEKERDAIKQHAITAAGVMIDTVIPPILAKLHETEAERDALAAAVGEIGEFAERYARPLVAGLRQLGEAGAVAELLDSAVDSVLELAAQVKDLASSHSRGPLARYRGKVLEEVRQLFQDVVARDGTTAMFDAELGRMAGESSTLPTNACTCDECLIRMAGEAGEWSRDIGPDGEQIRYDGKADK